MCGPALCHLAGTGSQALVVDIAWGHSLGWLLAYARRFGTLVCDAVSRSSSVLEYDMRAVGVLADPAPPLDAAAASRCLRPAYTTPNERLVVFEVVGERHVGRRHMDRRALV